MQPIGVHEGEQKAKVKEVNKTYFRTGVKKASKADKKGLK